MVPLACSMRRPYARAARDAEVGASTVTRKPDNVFPPIHRGRSLAHLEQLEHGMFAEVKRLPDVNLRVRFQATRETWLWRARVGDWFEEGERVE